MLKTVLARCCIPLLRFPSTLALLPALPRISLPPCRFLHCSSSPLRLVSPQPASLSINSKMKPQGLFALTFSPVCPPFAEVATYLLSTKATSLDGGLSLGLDYEPLSSVVSLLIPSSKSASKSKVRLGSKGSISRYFARYYPSDLYAELPLADQLAVDDAADVIRRADSNLRGLRELVAARVTGFLVGDRLSLADVLAWDRLITPDATSTITCEDPCITAYLARVKSASPVFDAASAAITQSLQFVYPIAFLRDHIAKRLGDALGIDVATALTTIENGKDGKDCDFSIVLPKLRLPGKPSDVAQEIIKKMSTDGIIDSLAVAGPFIYVQVNNIFLASQVIPQVLALGTEYGCNASCVGQTAVIDYSSPNIAKPFHAGHLRSTILGNYIKNVLECNGWNTVGINYLGDWGKQYGLLAMGYSQFGSEEELAKDPIKHLFEIYVKVNKLGEDDPSVHDRAREYFKRMEDGDVEALSLWEKFRTLSITKYTEIYARLNITFDVYSGESQFSKGLDKILQDLTDAGLLVEDEGAQIVDLKEWGLTPALIAKKDGSTLYITRDIAAAISRKKEYDLDAMYYVVGTQQELHFRQLFKVLALMGHDWVENCQHINFGMIKGMSTRKGNVVFLEDILDQTAQEMHDVMRKNEEKYSQVKDPEKVADIVGLTAIVIQDMSARRHKDYEFNWSRMLSFEGDTGPYLQYAHARLCSVERNSGIDLVSEKADLTPKGLNLHLLPEKEAHEMIRILAEYPDVIRRLPKDVDPVVLVTYVFRLSHAISVAWDKLWVASAPEDVKIARMAMYRAARIVVGNVLRILGLKGLERM